MGGSAAAAGTGVGSGVLVIVGELASGLGLGFTKALKAAEEKGLGFNDSSGPSSIRHSNAAHLGENKV